MPTYSRINRSIKMEDGFWLVSKVLSKNNSHTIIVFEGPNPKKPGCTWLWACDFVPAKYRYNDIHGGETPTHCYAIDAENIVGTFGVVRTSRPYGKRAQHKELYFTLSEKHFTPGEYTSNSWHVPIDVAKRVQQEINREEQDGTSLMYQSLGDKSVFSFAIRAWCSLFGESGSTGFNCESWVVDKLEKCGIKDVRTSLERVVSYPSL